MISVTCLKAVQDVIRDAVALDDEQPRDIKDVSADAALDMVQHTVHGGHALTPDGAMFAVCLMGVEHDYQATLGLTYEDEPDELPSCFDPSRHTEFASAVFDTLNLPESEVVRFIIMAWRMPDFSVQTLSLEPDGTFHDSITAPVFGRPLGTTMAVSDVIVDFASSLARQYWGRYWVASRCHHNKRPPEGITPLFMEMDDDDN